MRRTNRDDFIRDVIRAFAKEFPPHGHAISTIDIAGDSVTLHIAPKPGFAGGQKTLTFRIGNDQEAIQLGMMRAGFCQRQYAMSS